MRTHTQKQARMGAARKAAKRGAREAAENERRQQAAQLVAAVVNVSAQLKAVVAVVSELKGVVERTGKRSGRFFLFSRLGVQGLQVRRSGLRRFCQSRGGRCRR